MWFVSGARTARNTWVGSELISVTARWKVLTIYGAEK